MLTRKQKGKIRHTEYVYSDARKNKRRRFISKYMNVCQCCLKPYQDSDLNLHHLTYDRLGNELDEDLVLVCVLCHERLHKDETGKIPLYGDHLKNRYESIRKRRYIS